MTVDVPEPYLTALAHSRAVKVCDEVADNSFALFGRGMARMAMGRNEEATSDFLAAQGELKDACALELAFLNLQNPGSALEAIAELRTLLKRVEPKSLLTARAYHVLGIFEQRSGNIDEAVDAFQQSACLYRELNQPLGVAHVYDSHGQLEYSRGRHDLAAQYFALSIAEKSTHGDEFGTALTLGNLGRVNLELGRVRDAINCFESDLAIATRLDDIRGVAKMHDDLGRSYTLLEDYERAGQHLSSCLKKCKEHGFDELRVLALKDLATNLLRQGKTNESSASLSDAAELLSRFSTPYLTAVISEGWGDLWHVEGELQNAINAYEKSIEIYELEELPDREIFTRIKLARVLAKAGFVAKAQQSLCHGLRFIRGEGYARHLRELREAMLEVGYVETVVNESNRQLDASEAAIGSSYVKLSRLGQGAFGEVFRVFDSWRGDVFALKVFHLDKLYDVDRREQVLASAKTELTAASRVRHPGIVRIHAIGTFDNGQAYVLQDYIEGRRLNEVMRDVVSSVQILDYLANLADALSALHQADVIHRDLKPGNVIDRSSFGPVLIDFGIAHMPLGPSSPSQIVGTLPYMAPEQGLGLEIDGRADIFSLGVVAYQWFTGVLPRTFEKDMAVDDILARVNRPIPRPSSIRADIDASVEKLILAMLEKDPRDRPSSALDVATSMRGLAKACNDRA